MSNLDIFTIVLNNISKVLLATNRQIVYKWTQNQNQKLVYKTTLKDLGDT